MYRSCNLRKGYFVIPKMVSHIYILHFSDRIIYVSVHNSMYNLGQDYFNILKMHHIYIIISRCYESSNRLFTYYSVGIFRVRFSAIVRNYNLCKDFVIISKIDIISLLNTNRLPFYLLFR